MATTTNLDRYRKDLASLIARGEDLHHAIQFECYPKEMRKALVQKGIGNAEEFLGKLPSFGEAYQGWYSEAKAFIRQVLPDRLTDFVRHYEEPKPRKEVTYETYRIEDRLQELTVTRGYQKERVAGPEAAIPHVRQQLNIVKAAAARFESTLFDVRQLVQADLFDSELASAGALAKNGFARAAGVLAGVVLEKHLKEVSQSRSLTVPKKNPTIGDLNNVLKESDVIDVAQWRIIQHLADIRNLCGHDRKVEPTREQVADLIVGVTKVVKTLF